MPTERARFHPEAGAEYDAAFDWYLKRRSDAALRVDAEVDRAISEIVSAPQRWAEGPHSTRRFLLRHFPCTLIYRERIGSEIQSKAGILEGAPLDLDGTSRVVLHMSHRRVQLQLLDGAKIVNHTYSWLSG